MIRRVALDDFNSVAASKAAAAADEARFGPRLVPLENVEMKDIEWLDAGFVPEATLTILQGHGGVGKGAWTCQLAATVTRANPPGRVLFAVAEDDYASVLKPRLVAAGADLRYVQAVENVTLPEHIEWLDEQIAATTGAPIRLLVVDPVLTHLGGKVDSYKDHEVKRALRPLVALSERRRVTTVGVLHFTKDTGRGARFSGQASGAFGNTARSVLSMAVHDEDDRVRLVEVSKSNHAAHGLGRRYQLDLVAVAGLDTPQPVLRHDGDADKTVDQALKASSTKNETVDKQQIRDLIVRELTAGGKSLDYLKTVAKEIGATGNAVYTEANAMKAEGLVDCRKLGFDEGWRWELPNFRADEPPPSENGLNNELPPELPIHHESKTWKSRTLGPRTQEFGQKFGNDVTDDEIERLAQLARESSPETPQHARSVTAVATTTNGQLEGEDTAYG